MHASPWQSNVQSYNASMRAAVRSVVRRPGFAIVATLTLALGIGGNAAIFSVIEAVLLRPLPYPEADRLMMVWEFSAEIQQRFGLDRLPSSPADYTDFAPGTAASRASPRCALIA